MEESLISTNVRECLLIFKDLFESLPPGYQTELSKEAVLEELGRFKLWARNIGAHQIGNSSLDYRLSGAIHLRQSVNQNLCDLKSSLELILFKVRSILRGEKMQLDITSELDDDDDYLDAQSVKPEEHPKPRLTELQLSFRETIDIVDCLFDLSMSIRKSSSRPRFKQTALDVSFYHQPDFDHIRNKFRQIDGGRSGHIKLELGDALIERLTLANLERRQYFKYQERHHTKLEHKIEEDQKQSETLSQTIATKYEEGAVGNKVEPDSSVLSETSCATTGDDSNQRQFPPIPKAVLSGKPSQCPYCFDIIPELSKKAWRVHILCDLRPYVCILEGCASANSQTLFTTRHEWFDHEMKFHWSHWSCERCSLKFGVVSNFEKHLLRDHSLTAQEFHEQDLVTKCRVTTDLGASVSCPFCNVELTLRNRARHAGRHLEDVALFVLTWASEDEENKSHELDSNRAGNAGESEGDKDDLSDTVSSDMSLAAQAVIPDMSEITGEALNQQYSPHSPRPGTERQREYFLPGDGILREVIQADICRYLGNDALVRPGVYQGRQGYYIKGYRNLKSEMIADLKEDSRRWANERSHLEQRYPYAQGSSVQDSAASGSPTFTALWDEDETGQCSVESQQEAAVGMACEEQGR